ncbi:MAG: hypothetical protein HC822_07200 [Oscillochloris sp.]|nr:hypothetical protein [Oscillochloris sp.]
MLVIITPNPALDRTMVFEGLQLGAVHRTAEVLVAAGGKGLNVARVARTLSIPALVCAPLGGSTGDQVAQLAAAEQIVGQWYRHRSGETRTCVLLVDRRADDATALNEAGPTLSAADWAGFAASVQTAADKAQLCVVAGSLPAGVEAAALGTLLQDLAAAAKPVIVDTSAAALEAALATRPFGVKVNGSELSAALGMPVETVAEARAQSVRCGRAGLRLRP